MNYKAILIMITLLVLLSTKVVAEPMRDYPFEQISKYSWVIHGPLTIPSVENQGFMNNPGIVITEAGVVVVDPGSSLQAGEMVLRMIKKVTSAPVVATFNTHVHGDHWLGNQAIHNAYPDAPIYAHRNMITEAKEGTAERWLKSMERMTEGFTAGTKAVVATHPLEDGAEIEIGGMTFRVYNNGVAHTKTDIMVEAVEEGVLFLGDNATTKRFGNVKDGTFKGNIDALNIVMERATTVKHWVPGHGDTGSIAIPENFRDYLQTVYDAASFVFNEDLDIDEVKLLVMERTKEYSDWESYEYEIGRHASHAYLEVEMNEF